MATTPTLTTKGDLLAYSTAITRLAVGSAGAVLAADAAETTGLKWQDDSDYGYPPPISGRYLDYRTIASNGVGFTTGATITADTLYGVPIRLRKGTSLAAVACYLSAAGAGGTVMRMGLYAYDRTTGMAGALLLDAGTAAADGAAGVREATTGMPYVVPATGFYVAALVSNGAPGIIRLSGMNAAAHLGSATIVNTDVSFAIFSRAFTYATLPNPFGGSPAFGTSAFNIAVKIS